MHNEEGEQLKEKTPKTDSAIGVILILIVVSVLIYTGCTHVDKEINLKDTTDISSAKYSRK